MGDDRKAGHTRFRVSVAGAGREEVVGQAVAVLAGAAAFLLHPLQMPLAPRLLFSWCVVVITGLVLAWTVILRSSVDQTRTHAQTTDPGGAGALLVTVLVSLVSLSGAVYVLAAAEPVSAENAREGLVAAVVLVAVVGGWALMHTAFTLHYARMYYGNGDQAGGLNFPGPPPRELDFAYFAFGIGMTFQVSDVTIDDPRIRQMVLVHSLLSFLYSGAIIALTINIVSNII